ncbi:Acyl transferase domain-containing protein [Actinoalloteichus cyanogriseus DSM 43889]|uniref:Acyl transferase domain-containing protein n=1 Tax=Actinoalloteichus caeruleus DSM 43889 TaxID=1120930 RepID=A0ABT1JF61_ACTCY|nr:Acyl transferase domain-containing protein [Actinoalloteichus caeruleus DSM 43889]
MGLVRSAQAEHPGRLVLLDADDSAEAVRLALATGEPQVAVRDGRVFAPRLTPVAEDTAGRRSPTAHGTVLVTGGTGGVGSHVVRHLVHQWGATRVVVAARSDTGVADLVADCGEAVRFVPCDVSNPDELAGLLATLADTLAGVVHAAGVLDDGVLTSLTPDRLRRVAAPKAGAARTLDQLTRDLDLDFLVAFTSAAGVLGAPGQAAYAAANAEVDALMARRRRQGLPGQTVAWGLWADTGMARTLTASERRRLVTTGFPPLDPPRALELLDLAMTRAEPSLVALDLDPGQLARHPDPPALLTDLLPAARPRTAEPPPPPSDPLALVRAHLAAVLGHDDPRRVDAHRGLRELGVDSLAAVELRNRLSAATGRPLPATLAFDHPTAERLAAFLAADGHPEETPAAAPTAGSSDDPIAIVGLACRYPGGVRGPDDLWDLLTAEVDAIGPFPTDRGWDLHRVLGSDPTRPGTSSVGEGGFLDDAALFDAGLFGISPREALAMDPQQRQLLETSWEALEHAGIDPRSARGSRTGVFTGIMYHDYGPGFADAPPEVEGLLGAGTTGSVASGRVAHVLGLEGPALTVDTACSSSLVAVHLAARSLRTGESTLALAGGATVMSTPAAFVEFSRQGGLAADGRCKSFSEDADGTAWSEGVGVLVLERLSDARRHGRHVLGLLRGSAVNHDGAASGLTAPNGPAQRRVIRAALADAGLTARDVDVVEAHGTGTALGDPIEAHALLTTYGADREAPLLLGTVKSNLGHTQAAAGVAGVIKALLAMRHGTVPRTLHVTTPTSRVDWSAGAVRLATETRPWPDTPGPRRAAVSSFGFSGTNAHVVLEAPPPTPAREEPGRTENPVPLLLSGRTPSALRAQAARLAELVDTRPEVPLGALARSLAHTRARLDHRAVVLADDRPAASAALGALARGETNPRLVSGVVPVHQLAVVFGGQGSQRIGMGRELHDRFPVYADTFDRVCAALDAELAADRPLAEVVFGADADALDRTGWAQPALFAVEAALHALVSSWGVRAEVVAGHSVGELTAAYVAGVWDLPDACRVVAARARLMDALPDGGAMVAVAAGRGEVEELLVPGAGVGAVNGPTSVVVSGESGAVATVAEAAEARGLRTRALRVSHAFHSHLVEPVLADFARVLREVRFAAPTLPGLSNVTGGPADRWTDPDYWVDHVRAPVLFADDLAALEASGVDAVLELGADATLTGLAATVLAEPGRAVAALRRDRPEAASLLAAVGELYCAGVPVEWDDLFGAGDWVDLPTYPFDRERFWLTGTSRPAADTSGLGVTGTDHPLLAAAVEVPGTGAVVLTGALSTTSRPWLADHRVLGQVVVPGAAIVEMAVRAGDEVGRGTVDELVTTAPLVLSDHEPTQLRLVVARENDQGHRPFTLHARLESEGEWRVHATGALSAGPDHAPARTPTSPAAPPCRRGPTACTRPSPPPAWTTAPPSGAARHPARRRPRPRLRGTARTGTRLGHRLRRAPGPARRRPARRRRRPAAARRGRRPAAALLLARGHPARLGSDRRPGAGLPAQRQHRLPARRRRRGRPRPHRRPADAPRRLPRGCARRRGHRGRPARGGVAGGGTPHRGHRRLVVGPRHRRRRPPRPRHRTRRPVLGGGQRHRPGRRPRPRPDVPRRRPVHPHPARRPHPRRGHRRPGRGPGGGTGGPGRRGGVGAAALGAVGEPGADPARRHRPPPVGERPRGPGRGRRRRTAAGVAFRSALGTEDAPRRRRAVPAGHAVDGWYRTRRLPRRGPGGHRPPRGAGPRRDPGVGAGVRGELP